MTLTLHRSLAPRGLSRPMRSPVSALPTGAAEAACAPFFARYASIGAEDRRATLGAVVEVLAVGAERPLANVQRPSVTLHLLVEGWAYRAQALPNGARQITDIILPGDLFGWTSTAADGAGEEVRTLEPARIVVLRKEDVLAARELMGLRRIIEVARDAEMRRLRARLVSLGCRAAYERVAYFFAEAYDRLHAVGMADDGAFRCPLTQQQLGEVLGLTTVHVNRVLQRLRSDGLIAYDRLRIFLPDLDRLHMTAGFHDAAG